MGRDDYIVIRKEGRKYKGYTQFAQDSVKEDFGKNPRFIDTSLRRVILKAQAENAEYGYRIDGI